MMTTPYLIFSEFLIMHIQFAAFVRSLFPMYLAISRKGTGRTLKGDPACRIVV
jgi:hypothetical protein